MGRVYRICLVWYGTVYVNLHSAIVANFSNALRTQKTAKFSRWDLFLIGEEKVYGGKDLPKSQVFSSEWKNASFYILTLYIEKRANTSTLLNLYVHVTLKIVQIMKLWIYSVGYPSVLYSWYTFRIRSHSRWQIMIDDSMIRYYIIDKSHI